MLFSIYLLPKHSLFFSSSLLLIFTSTISPNLLIHFNESRVLYLTSTRTHSPSFTRLDSTRHVAMIPLSSIRRICKLTLLVVTTIILLRYLFPTGNIGSMDSGGGGGTVSALNRKMLQVLHGETMTKVETAAAPAPVTGILAGSKEETNRIWGDKCSRSDIVINQGPTSPLPNGIPTYTVEIMNVCLSGCNISAIHLNCGWFSSARFINPRVFKRLHYNDCLVNDGKPLINGRTVSFQYANTFYYPLSVSSVFC